MIANRQARCPDNNVEGGHSGKVREHQAGMPFEGCHVYGKLMIWPQKRAHISVSGQAGK